jgi:hypothetical protein
VLSWRAVDRRSIIAITQRQQSLIATRQFEAAGGTPDALRWAVRDRWLEPFRWRSVFVVVGAAPARYRPLMGACLAAGPDAHAGGLGAAYLYGAPDVAPALELVLFGGRARLEGVVSRTTSLPPDQLVTVRHGVPTVTAEFCVAQVAGFANPLAERVANNFVDRGLATFPSILACLETVAPHGRGAAKLRAFLHRELQIGGHDDSPAARRLGRALLKAGLGPFETQYKVDTGEGLALLDFAWPAVKVGLEYLGERDHLSSRAQIENDARRRGRLAALGWRILDATAGMSCTEVVRWTTGAVATGHEPA